MERTRTSPIILVVEDYRDSRQMLRLLLESMNYCVFTAANGNDALDTALKNHVDLVLTDFGLPDMTGAVLVERLRKLDGNKCLPIVMVTAFDGDEYRREAVKAGCNEFLVKPLDGDHLDGVLQRLLDHKGS